MMKKAWLVLPGFLLLSGFAPGQIQTSQQQPRVRVDDFAIRGKIIISSAREGDMRIEVRLEKATLQLINTTFTDSAGNFEFRGLQAGTYYVSVNLEGYEAVRQSVEIYNQIGTANLSIFLKKAAPFRDKATGLDAADPDIVDVSQMKEALPKKAVQDYEKALEEKKKGQTDKAAKLLEEAVQLAPNFYHAHNNLGLLYQAAKRYRDAEREYQRARDLNRKNVQPLTNLGVLYIEESDERKSEGEEVVGKLLDQALDTLELAIKVDPRSVIAYYYLGSANYKSSFFPEAEAALTRALDMSSNPGPVRLMLVNVYMKERKWQAVLQNLDAYLQENPKANDRAAIEEMRAKIAKGLEAAKQ